MHISFVYLLDSVWREYIYIYLGLYCCPHNSLSSTSLKSRQHDFNRTKTSFFNHCIHVHFIIKMTVVLSKPTRMVFTLHVRKNTWVVRAGIFPLPETMKELFEPIFESVMHPNDEAPMNSMLLALAGSHRIAPRSSPDHGVAPGSRD